MYLSDSEATLRNELLLSRYNESMREEMSSEANYWLW